MSFHMLMSFHILYLDDLWKLEYLSGFLRKSKSLIIPIYFPLVRYHMRQIAKEDTFVTWVSFLTKVVSKRLFLK